MKAPKSELVQQMERDGKGDELVRSARTGEPFEWRGETYRCVPLRESLPTDQNEERTVDTGKSPREIFRRKLGDPPTLSSMWAALTILWVVLFVAQKAGWIHLKFLTLVTLIMIGWVIGGSLMWKDWADWVGVR